MSDILLLEPKYKNKYPPLGLMKISYFHKYIHNDYVLFSKGELPDAYKFKKWDRVYVSTLFTFEWEKTKEIISYACKVVNDIKNVYVGGILATLMPDLIRREFPNINIIEGLLNKVGTLGLKDEENIDTITPDYGILDDIEYTYPSQDAYFLYMTRGCGMKCQFCAVQTLEPSYIPYCSIKNAVKNIDEKFGPKKDLLLMDNNVLRSPNFDSIIDEIKDLGFGKDATYINPKTGKSVKRYVDFNQGLDAFLLTEHKAKKLGELAIRPARIAFDHIEDKSAYVKAIRLCAENGITHMSNYLLYNGEDFKGKGHSYSADTPDDLYNRMKISMDLCDELNQELDHKVFIFSFPMRYIPLSDTKRGYVGDNWNPKYLRALQRMLIPTQGKGVSTRSFFEADFGKSSEEFVEFLAMPEYTLGIRGHFVVKKDEAVDQSQIRKNTWYENQEIVKEWLRLFRGLNHQKDTFISYIKDNEFTFERFKTIRNLEHRKLFLHYFTIPGLLRVLNEGDEVINNEIKNYISEEFPIYYKRIVEYIADIRLPYSLLKGFFILYKERFVKDILKVINIKSEKADFILDNLIKVQNLCKYNIFKFELIKYARIYIEAGVFCSDEEYLNLINSILALDEKKIKEILINNIATFKNIILEKNRSEIASDLIIEKVNSDINYLYEQLSLF